MAKVQINSEIITSFGVFLLLANKCSQIIICVDETIGARKTPPHFNIIN